MADLIPLPGTIGNVFTIDRSQWIAINDRVELVISAKPVANDVSQVLPSYLDLLAVCEKWKSTTFASLIAQAVAVNLFAQRAADALAKLKARLTGLRPSDPVPQDVAFIFKADFATLEQMAANLRNTAVTLATAVDALVKENRVADQVLTGIGESLASLWPPLKDFWQPIAGTINLLEGALTDVQTDWDKVTAILNAGASQSVTITVAALLATDITGAVDAWQRLQNVTLAFDSMASTLTFTC